MWFLFGHGSFRTIDWIIDGLLVGFQKMMSQFHADFKVVNLAMLIFFEAPVGLLDFNFFLVWGRLITSIVQSNPSQ